MRQIILCGLAVFILVGSALAQEREMIIPVPQSAYSQAVKIKGGTLVFLSGVGPADEKGVLAAPVVFLGRWGVRGEKWGVVWGKAGGMWRVLVRFTVRDTIGTGGIFLFISV